ncbi:MAG: hypothetical protein PUP46_09795 [Endozoicomonas sp. (ex Botrylloides leachii)]|nr:hypothetical protein [Endozoicomonas sp. (ex Botrylloides leachii)]
MEGPSNTQQAALNSKKILPSHHGQSVKNGIFRAENLTATINSLSLLANNAEEQSLFVSGKKTKLNIRSKKDIDEKLSQKMQKNSKSTFKDIASDINFSEEIASLVRLIKKFNKNEEMSEEENKELERFKISKNDEFNTIADKLLKKAEEVIDSKGRKSDFSKELDDLRNQLNNAKNNNEQIDNTFWSKLSELSVLSDEDKLVNGEISRKYAENLSTIYTKLVEEYGTTKLFLPIAVEIKKIGCELMQVNNSAQRIIILGKEMYALQSLWALSEHCDESEQKYDRMFEGKA